jgi:hypothetical protein
MLKKIFKSFEKKKFNFCPSNQMYDSLCESIFHLLHDKLQSKTAKNSNTNARKFLNAPHNICDICHVFISNFQP